MPRIKAVLFDFDGVIAEPAFRQSLIMLGRNQGMDVTGLPREALRALKDSGHMTGHGSSEAFWTLLQERTSLRADYRQLENELIRRSTPREAMLVLSDHLRERGCVTAILSDHTPILDRIEEINRFFHRFDRVFNSYYLGMGKIDPQVFVEVTRQLDVAPEETAFTDDNPGNVRRARSRGLHGLDFVDPDRLALDLETLMGAGD